MRVSRVGAYSRLGLLAVLACSALLAACALSPTSEQAAEFGKAATASLEAYTSAREAEMDMKLRRSVESSACKYVEGADFSLPSRAQPLTPSGLAQQIAFLQAIIAYSKALANATNPDGVAELETSG